jgi:hypothetical protein
MALVGIMTWYGTLIGMSACLESETLSVIVSFSESVCKCYLNGCYEMLISMLACLELVFV